MKFLREGKSKSIYDDFFHDTISELKNIRLIFLSFNLFVPSLPKQQTTANSFSVVSWSFVMTPNPDYLWAYVNAVKAFFLFF